MPATSLPKSGSVTATAGITSAVASFGSQCELLLLGATLDERASEDLGTRDQRAADPEAGPGEFLGGHDHAHVLGVAALAVAAVLGRHAQAERAEFGEAGDDLLGHVAVRAMDVLGVRGDHVAGERTERVGDHLHVAVEMAWSRLIGERRQELRIAVRA